MATLILINGIPASGKSTVARAWCQRPGRDLALALDIDVLRSMLGGWQHDVVRSGTAARALACAAIAAHLARGYDVVVPQYLGRPEFADELAQVAARAGSAFLECAILVDPATASDRFARRREAGPGGPGSDRHGVLDRSMETIAEDFDRFVRARPGIVLLDQRGDLVDQIDAHVQRVARP